MGISVEQRVFIACAMMLDMIVMLHSGSMLVKMVDTPVNNVYVSCEHSESKKAA